MNQRSIFDLAERKKQHGIEAAYQGASSIWRSAAGAALLQCAKTYREFTSDEVWPILAKQGIHTHNNSAMGAVFQSASRSGIIQKTGHYRESNRPEAHQRPLAIWRSNLYKEGN